MPYIFHCCNSGPEPLRGIGLSFCFRRVLRGSGSGNCSNRGEESCCFRGSSTPAEVFRCPGGGSLRYRIRPHTRMAGSSGMIFLVLPRVFPGPLQGPQSPVNSAGFSSSGETMGAGEAFVRAVWLFCGREGHGAADAGAVI